MAVRDVHLHHYWVHARFSIRRCCFRWVPPISPMLHAHRYWVAAAGPRCAQVTPHTGKCGNEGGTCLATQWKVYVRRYGVLLADPSAARAQQTYTPQSKNSAPEKNSCESSEYGHVMASSLCKRREATINNFPRLLWLYPYLLSPLTSVTTSHNYRANFSWAMPYNSFWRSILPQLYFYLLQYGVTSPKAPAP